MEFSTAVLPARLGLKEAETWLRLLVSPLQLTVGLGLMLNPRSRMLNVSALVIVVLFSIYQVIHWMIDGSPCDRLGIVMIDPHWIGLIDFAAVPLIAMNIRSIGQNLQAVKSKFRIEFIWLFLLLGIAAVAWAGKRYLESSADLEVTVAVTHAENGRGNGHYYVYGKLVLTNRTSNRLSLLGTKQSCTCTSVETNYPQHIEGSAVSTIPIVISVMQEQLSNDGSLRILLFLAGTRSRTVFIQESAIIEAIDSLGKEVDSLPKNSS